MIKTKISPTEGIGIDEGFKKELEDSLISAIRDGKPSRRKKLLMSSEGDEELAEEEEQDKEKEGSSRYNAVLYEKVFRVSYNTKPTTELYFLLGFDGGRQGSGPDRGRSPVEYRDFLSVHPYVRLSVPPSGPSSQA